MSKILLLIVLLSFGSNSAFTQQKEIFLKQVDFKLSNVSDKDYENEYFMTIKLNKGTSYKFKITNHRENFIGQAVLELLDADHLILTNSIGEKYYETVGFVCNKTAFYDILIKYKDKKPGYSVVDIVMLQ
jgi:hypothetical protein